MRNRVDLKLTKDWGGMKKGDTMKNLNRAYARRIQDNEKAGEIVETVEKDELAVMRAKLKQSEKARKAAEEALMKATRPPANKVEKEILSNK